MPPHLTSLADSGKYSAADGLQRLRKLLACLAPCVLLCGCANMLADGMELTHAVTYPMRSPEHVLRDLGGKRYLLAQWDVPLNGNSKARVRYYDRNTGILTPLPEEVTVFRDGYAGNILGALRYESDSPLQIAFFTRSQTGYEGSCEQTGTSDVDKAPPHLCGFMDIVLSLDGARSFGWRRMRIPTSMGRGMIAPRKYEFAIVRNNTLYLGLYVNSSKLPEVCCQSDSQNLVDRSGVSYARRFKGTAVADSGDVFLGVLALPLPENGGKPLPAEHIPRVLSAELLTGQALLDFDPGQPMALLDTPPAAAPKAPRGQHTRSDREAYIASLRAEYPEWAAHQRLDDIPRRQQWMSSQKLNALRAKQAPRGDDPVEWVRFESPAPK